MDVALPLAAYEAVANKTFVINASDSSSYFHSYNVKSVHFDTVDIANTEFDQVMDENKVHVHMTGIDFTANQVEADFNFLYFFSFEPKSISFKNVDIDFVLESASEDNVHWKLVETT